MIDGPTISHRSWHQPSRPGANICLLMTVGPLLNITQGMVNYTSRQHCWPPSESVYQCPNVHSKIWFHSGMFESSAVTLESALLVFYIRVSTNHPELVHGKIITDFWWCVPGVPGLGILGCSGILGLRYTGNSDSNIPATLSLIKTGNVIAWYNLPSHDSHLLFSYAHSLFLQAARSTDQTCAQLLICRYTATSYPERLAWHWLVAS